MLVSQEVIKAYQVVKSGGVLLYPTDTIYGLGCDAMNESGIERIFQIKRRDFRKRFIILLDTAEKLTLYLEQVPAIAWDLLEQTVRPTTFIYPSAKNLPSNLLAEDGSIAIRIVDKHEFCRRLISMLGHPLVSTSANISGQLEPITFDQISEEIKNAVDYIVPPLHFVEDLRPSTIIRLIDDYNFEIIRE
ncbi:MAG: threonylcarbamoyl-AMP synthase [Bacteroidales bacterium]|jgi:L-threonylcarbamoyladenylate synthase|nr:threonylcarbamoyl-AMP synthase [Bacteroidales bacterium]